MPKPNFTNEQNKIEEIIRVDYAGEYGAARIYKGQIRFTRNLNDKVLISSMLEHELVHLDYFERQLKQRKIPPTLFMPLWYVGGYMIGAISAICGLKTAMLITEAVEDIIEEHYNKQLNYLNDLPKENELSKQIMKFKQDEIDHKHIAINSKSQQAFLARPFTKLVKKICETAIFMSKKL